MSQPTLNGPEMMRALHWMLEEAQCYVGAQWINDPLEAAERIVLYFNDIKDNNPTQYADLISRAIAYAKDPTKE